MYILSGITVIATYLINYNVRLYGDDFFYLRFTQGDLGYFIIRHIEHYFRANGRVIVHLLCSIFLGWDIHIWQIVNSLMLGGIVLIGAKLAANTTFHTNKKVTHEGVAALILGVSIAFLNIDITRQSVYWLTGSFNYVYPLLVLLIYWYLLHKRDFMSRSAWVVPLMAFISAATTEQVGLMSFGLTLITIVEYKVILKKKTDRLLLFSFFASLSGMLTVIAAPSVFYRASIEDAPVKGFIALIKYNILHQGNSFIFSKSMALYILVAAVSSLGAVLLLRRKSGDKKRNFHRSILLYSSCSICSWILYKLLFGDYSIVNKIRANSIYSLLFFFIGTGIILIMAYASINIYKCKADGNFSLPYISLILCIGSQVMMVISPVYGSRNLLPAVIMLALSTAVLIPVIGRIIITLIQDFTIFKSNRSIVKMLVAVGYISMILISTGKMSGTINGYGVNALVYDMNIIHAKQYALEMAKGKTGTGGLTQQKLPNASFAWMMPYDNSYYTPYYNLFIGLPSKEKIIWQ